MTALRRGQLARVTGDSAHWQHGFNLGELVRTVEPERGFGDEPGWHCQSPRGNWEWWVADADLEPADATRAAVIEAPKPLGSAASKGGHGILDRPISETGGAKDKKLADFAAIPQYPLRLLAERYGLGAHKYGPAPNGLDNWRAGYAWSLSYSALQRHLAAFWSGEDIDDETGQPHLAAAAWHVFALLEWGRHRELAVRYDDRQDPKTGQPGEGR